MATTNQTASLGGHAGHGEAVTRRDFLYVATAATGAVGAVAATWPLINNLNPAADTLALASVELSLKGIEVIRQAALHGGGPMQHEMDPRPSLFILGWAHLRKLLDRLESLQ